MRLDACRTRSRAAAAAVAAALLATTAAVALAGSSITKHQIEVISIPAGQTRTLTVPYPDALKYGNARYSGRVEVLAPPLRADRGRAPNLKQVRIVRAQSVLGGSDYQVRAHNANSVGTAAARLKVTATTVEPLPHG